MKVQELKNNDVIVICECGKSCTLHYNEEKNEIELIETFKKPEEKTDETKKPENRKSFFNRS